MLIFILFYLPVSDVRPLSLQVIVVTSNTRTVKEEKVVSAFNACCFCAFGTVCWTHLTGIAAG